MLRPRWAEAISKDAWTRELPQPTHEKAPNPPNDAFSRLIRYLASLCRRIHHNPRKYCKLKPM